MSRHHGLRGDPPVPYALIGAMVFLIVVMMVVVPVTLALRDGRPLWFVALVPFAGPAVFGFCHLVGFVVMWIVGKWKAL